MIDGSRDAIASRRLDEAVMKANIAIEPVTAEQAHIARAAYRDFGKGSGHPASLNFGDVSPTRSRRFSVSRCYLGKRF